MNIHSICIFLLTFNTAKYLSQTNLNRINSFGKTPLSHKNRKCLAELKAISIKKKKKKRQ